MKLRTLVPALIVASLLVVSTAHAGHYGRHYGRSHHHHGGGNGAAIALGVAGAVIGTAIIANAITRPRTTYVVQEAPPVRVHYYAPAPTYYERPRDSAYYPSARDSAYDEGYRAGIRDARNYAPTDRPIDYGIGGNPYYNY